MKGGRRVDRMRWLARRELNAIICVGGRPSVVADGKPSAI